MGVGEGGEEQEVEEKGSSGPERRRVRRDGWREMALAR